MTYTNVTQLPDATDPDGAATASTWEATDDGGVVRLNLPLGATLAEATAKFNGAADLAAPPAGKQVVYTGRGAVLADLDADGQPVNPVDVLEADDAGGLAVTLVSAGGRRYRLTVSDAGALTTTEIV